MSNKKNKNGALPSAENKRIQTAEFMGKHFIKIFVSVFLLFAIVFGTVLGIVSAIRSGSAAVSYKGVVMDAKTLSFFQSYYKKLYMSALSNAGVENVYDEPAFWNSVGEGEKKSYGELLRENSELYVKQIVAANYLYDNYSRVTKSEREAIREAAMAVVLREADGSTASFNDQLSAFGFKFDYEAMLGAAEMIYKADSVKRLIYGTQGSSLKDGSISDASELCDEYLMEYTHVKLIVLNTETKYKLDENGKKIVGFDGKYETEALTEKERSEILEDVENIRTHIANIGTDEAQMSPTMFDMLHNNFIEDGKMEDSGLRDGYYFHPDSEFTEGFPEEYLDIVERAYEMEPDSYSEVKLGDQVCFIYKLSPTKNIYKTSLSEACFGDFYSDLAAKLFHESISLYSEEVSFTDKYDPDEIILLPYNYKYIPRF